PCLRPDNTQVPRLRVPARVLRNEQVHSVVAVTPQLLHSHHTCQTAVHGVRRHAEHCQVNQVPRLTNGVTHGFRQDQQECSRTTQPISGRVTYGFAPPYRTGDRNTTRHLHLHDTIAGQTGGLGCRGSSISTNEQDRRDIRSCHMQDHHP